MRTITQKRTKVLRVLSVLFVAMVIVVFCALLIGCNDANEKGSEKDLPEITGITVVRNVYDYDGQAHGIALSGTLSTDKIYYSTDGVNWQENEIFKTEAGEYEIYYKVIRQGYAEYVQSETLVITRNGITGVFACDVTCIIGKPIIPNITGLQENDGIKYSINESEYKEQIEITTVGIYTVAYIITRPNVGTSEGTFKLTVLPNISGTYIGNGERVILTDTTIILNGEEYNITYRTDGNGQADINGKAIAFSVKDNTLTINEKEYVKINDNSHVVELRINNAIYYATTENTATVEITFEDNNAIIKVNNVFVVKIAGYNYCESVLNGSAISRDYLTNSVRFTLSSDFADITLSLLNDEKISTIEDKEVIYNGEPHAIEIEYENVLYLNDGVYEDRPKYYTEVGEYVYTVVILRDGYLPCVLEGKLTILPDLSGIYVSDSNGIIEIDGLSAKINNVEVEFEHGLTGGRIGDELVEYGNGVITIKGIEYVKTEDPVIAFVIGEVVKVLECDKDYEVRVVETDNMTTVSIYEEGEDYERYFGVIAGKVVSVTVGEEQLSADEGVYYISSYEPDSLVVWVVFGIL